MDHQPVAEYEKKTNKITVDSESKRLTVPGSILGVKRNNGVRKKEITPFSGAEHLNK